MVFLLLLAETLASDDDEEKWEWEWGYGEQSKKWHLGEHQDIRG
jgi:hypothetical protein